MARKSSTAQSRSQSTPNAPRSGNKKRTPTSTSHRGSRVEPSHVTEQQRTTREKRSAKGR